MLENKNYRSITRNRKGSTSTEYGITAALMVMTIVGSVSVLGWIFSGSEEKISSALRLDETEISVGTNIEQIQDEDLELTSDPEENPSGTVPGAKEDRSIGKPETLPEKAKDKIKK